jgi:hypothetical protein
MKPRRAKGEDDDRGDARAGAVAVVVVEAVDEVTRRGVDRHVAREVVRDERESGIPVPGREVKVGAAIQRLRRLVDVRRVRRLAFLTSTFA